MIERILMNTLQKKMFSGKVLVLIGPRQVGKTTLIQNLLEGYQPEDILQYNGDYLFDREILSEQNIEILKNTMENKKILFIDEAQKIENLGNIIKILADIYKETKQIILTGSSTIHILNNVEETLTGRKNVFYLYPFSIQEQYNNEMICHKSLEELLIFGMYPEVRNTNNRDIKKEYLHELTSSALYKDILEFQNIKNPHILTKLLQALALQIGNQVSYAELSNVVGIDKNTVERYVDLLEKNLIIFRLPPYTKNKRREISKQKKIYFYDVGIRNTLIHNYNNFDIRDDIGALFENFCIVERMKHQAYHAQYTNQYFLRTYDGSEIDLIEEKDGKLFGYEYKWTEKKKTSFIKKWEIENNTQVQIIHQNNIYSSMQS
jgi:uncharacterized protein